MLKMPFGNTNFVTLLTALYVAGMTGTVCGYAEHAAFSLADVAHMRQFESTIHSSNPPWYRDGMKHWAWNHNGYKWNNSPITWRIEGKASNVDEKDVVKICEKCFETWSEAMPRSFAPALPDKKVNIRIWFTKNMESWRPGYTTYPETTFSIDGVDIYINDNMDWNDKRRDGRVSLPHVMLHEIGHAVGLGHSLDSCSVMREYTSSTEKRVYPDYFLAPDDSRGIEKLYEEPPRRRNHIYVPRR